MNSNTECKNNVLCFTGLFLVALFFHILLFYLVFNRKLESKLHENIGSKHDPKGSVREFWELIALSCTTESLETTDEKAHKSSTSTVPSTTINSTEYDVVNQYLMLLHKNPSGGSITIDTKCETALKTPVTSIYISESHQKNCYSHRSCKEQIMPSIDTYGQYNFIVSGDGSIFESSSWIRSTIANTSIHIVLTGDSNYLDDQIRDVQYDSVALLIKANVISGKISSEYRVGPICCFAPLDIPCDELYTKLSGFNNFMSDCKKHNHCSACSTAEM